MRLPLGEWLRACARTLADHPPLMFYDPGLWACPDDSDEGDEADAARRS
ncbi:hypothetical protein [Spongiactinospora gelatinilytica]|nr:hypothetical protein [Spongiactinospora gelatinilytica]